jgi:hypothetical protein
MTSSWRENNAVPRPEASVAGPRFKNRVVQELRRPTWISAIALGCTYPDSVQHSWGGTRGKEIIDLSALGITFADLNEARLCVPKT